MAVRRGEAKAYCVAAAQGLDVEEGQRLVALEELERGNVSCSTASVSDMTAIWKMESHWPLTILQKIQEAILPAIDSLLGKEIDLSGDNGSCQGKNI